MTGANLKTKLAARQPVYGTMLGAAHPPRWLWMLRQLELDFAVIDTEHAALGRAEVASLASAIALVGCVPFVRIPDRNPMSVAQAVDAGAHGIIVPYCETVDEVSACVRAARYHPVKGGRLTDAFRGRPLSAKTAAVLRRANRNAVVVIGIESEPAVEAIEALITAEAVDAVFVGTQDLSYSLGHPNELDHPVVVTAFERILRVCTRHGVAVAIWPLSVTQARRWIARGMRLVLHSSDYHAMVEGFRIEFEQLRRPRRRAKRS